MANKLSLKARLEGVQTVSRYIVPNTQSKMA